MSKLKIFLIATASLLTISNNTPAQDRSNTLEARITFFDEVVTEKKYEGKYAAKGLALTFINNSGQDIYIPYFLPIIQNKYIPFRSVDSFFTYYKKDSIAYKELLKPERKDKPGEFSNDIGGLGYLMEPFSNRTKVKYDKLKVDVGRALNNKKIDSLLSGFYSMAIFIKAHQEWEYYLPTMLSPYASLGSYKITFEPTLTMPNKDEYPDMLMGYKKFYPTEIKCVPLFVRFEPLRREDNESLIEQVQKMAPGLKIKAQ